MKKIVILLKCVLFFMFSLSASAGEIKGITITDLNKMINESKQETLVNLWATWCEPCKKEFPIFLELQKTKKNLNVILVSMDYDSQKSEVEKFLKSQKVNFQTYMKSGNEVEFIEGFLKEWQGALPVTVLYGPKGKVKKVWQGEVTKEMLDSHL